MKIKTKREEELCKESMKLGFTAGKEYVHDTLFCVFIGVILLTLCIFAAIGIESLIL